MTPLFFLSGRGSLHPLLLLPPLSLLLPLIAEVELDCLTETLVIRFSAGTFPALDSSEGMSATDSSTRSFVVGSSLTETAVSSLITESSSVLVRVLFDSFDCSLSSVCTYSTPIALISSLEQCLS